MASSSRTHSSFSAAGRGGSPLAADLHLPSDATDTISSVRWSPVANHLAAGAWDGKLRVYDVATGGASRGGIAVLTADGPIFSCGWSKDGTIIAAAGADRNVRLLHCSTGQTMILGTHAAPVRSVCFVDVPSSAASPIVASGSWDRTVQYWDLRHPGKALATLHCADRVYAMDSAGKLLVIATAERHIHLVDLYANPGAFSRTTLSPLRHQTRVVTALPDGKAWATAGIEGRCGINAVDDADARVNFTFRCHRDEMDAKKAIKVWTVNDVRFHPVYQKTFCTAGSDGTFHFWDRTAHQRLRGYPSVGGAINAVDFNHDGNLLAYAVGYDWSMGYMKNTPDYPIKLMLHPVAENEVKPRKKST